MSLDVGFLSKEAVPSTRVEPLSMLAAGLGERLRSIPPGSILACGPARHTTDLRASDEDACAAAYWRPPGGSNRTHIGVSVRERPVPALGAPRRFW